MVCDFLNFIIIIIFNIRTFLKDYWAVRLLNPFLWLRINNLYLKHKTFYLANIT